MSTNYIHSEASKEQSLWDDLANYYEEITDVSAVDAVDIGALFSATSASIGSAIANSKERKVATIIVTGANGTTLNYGVNHPRSQLSVGNAYLNSIKQLYS